MSEMLLRMYRVMSIVYAGCACFYRSSTTINALKMFHGHFVDQLLSVLER